MGGGGVFDGAGGASAAQERAAVTEPREAILWMWLTTEPRSQGSLCSPDRARWPVR